MNRRQKKGRKGETASKVKNTNYRLRRQAGHEEMINFGNGLQNRTPHRLYGVDGGVGLNKFRVEKKRKASAKTSGRRCSMTSKKNRLYTTKTAGQTVVLTHSETSADRFNLMGRKQGRYDGRLSVNQKETRPGKFSGVKTNNSGCLPHNPRRGSGSG